MVGRKNAKTAAKGTKTKKENTYGFNEADSNILNKDSEKGLISIKRSPFTQDDEGKHTIVCNSLPLRKSFKRDGDEQVIYLITGKCDSLDRDTASVKGGVRCKDLATLQEVDDGVEIEFEVDSFTPDGEENPIYYATNFEVV